MPCYSPLKAFYSKETNPSGKRSLVFNEKQALQPDVTIQIPCGKCIGCRLERSRQWAMRCLHESKMHQDNCFITLTYNEKNLPADGSLIKQDFQKFVKRLRKQVAPQKLRYYMCGEYGGETSRPHFHACIFGYRPNDLTTYRINNGHRLYNSKSLEKIWSQGYVVIGELTFESAAYVARYVMKKIYTSEESPRQLLSHYESMNEYGEITTRLPEYNQASLKPAIGKTWLDKYGNYVQDHDFIIMNGKKLKPPKYYDRVLEREDPINVETRKELRSINAKKFSSENTLERLAVKEFVHGEQIKSLKRNKQ